MIRFQHGKHLVCYRRIVYRFLLPSPEWGRKIKLITGLSIGFMWEKFPLANIMNILLNLSMADPDLEPRGRREGRGGGG